MGAFRSFRFFMFGIPVLGRAVDRKKKKRRLGARYSEVGKQMDLAPGEQELLDQIGHAFLASVDLHLPQ